MSPERWQQCKEIFQAAQVLPLSQRADYVQEACGGDEELRAEVLSLFQFHDRSDDFLSQTAPRYLAGERTPEPRLEQRLSPGKLLSERYRIQRLIGRGGMGEVYESFDMELGSRVALKLIRPEIALGAEVLDRFKREVYLARQVTHPNVCRIFDLGYHAEPGEKTAFLTMELLSGETLAEHLKEKGAMTTDEALPLIKKMTAGLSAAHKAGIIHRDFKSANVMLVRDAAAETGAASDVKVMDFGLARVASGGDKDRTTLSAATVAVGTPAYMAPEQVEGGEITAATDIYALGVVMYEMVTGTLPFDGDSPWIVATKRLLEAPPSPRSRIANLDWNWEAAILRCLERNPAARFQSAIDVYNALSVESPDHVPTPAGMKRKRRRRFTGAVLAGVLVLAVGASSYLVTKLPKRSANGGVESADSRAAQFGWHRETFQTDVSLTDTKLAAGPMDPLKILLFGPSFVRSWAPGQGAAPPLPTQFTITDRAECGPRLWLIHDDRRHITEWDPGTEQPIATVSFPWSFTSGVCLDDTATRWGLLLNRKSSSWWIEFDSRTQQSVREIPLGDLYVKATIHPRRDLIAFIGANHVSVRRAERLDEMFHDTLDEKFIFPWAAAWSEKGRYLATGFKQLLVYDVARRKRLRKLTTSGWISAIGWVGDEGVSVMDDRGRLYWAPDLSKGWQLTVEPQAIGVYAPFWIPMHYRWLAFDTSGQRQGQTWQYVTPSLLFDLPVSPLDIWSVAVSPDGSKLAVSGKDPRIFILDRQRRTIERVLEGHTDGISYVRFEQPNRLISASDDRTIRVWDTSTGKLLQTASGHESLVNAFAISPDRQWLVSVSSDNHIKLWRLPQLTFVRDLGTTSSAGAAVAFLPNDNGRLLISDWKGKIYRYEGAAPNWSEREEYQLSNGGIYMVCPGHDAWWAVGQEPNAAGLWFVPARDLQEAVRISSEPAYYCSTGDDGRLTAIQFANRIELRSNAGGSVAATYRFAAKIGDAVAIAHAPPMVVAGFGDGHLLGWPLEVR